MGCIQKVVKQYLGGVDPRRKHLRWRWAYKAEIRVISGRKFPKSNQKEDYESIAKQFFHEGEKRFR